MALVNEIVASYRGPGAALRRRLAEGVREDRAVAALIIAVLLLFIAQTPSLARAARHDPSVPLEARLAISLFAVVFLLPLIAYALAALSHVAALVIGGRGSFHAARLALFHALLAVSPLALVQGLAAGFVGQGMALSLLGGLVFAVFLWIWFAALIAAEFLGD